MNKSEKSDYKPGDYGRSRKSAADWTEANVRHWNWESSKSGGETKNSKIYPCICFSRQIGTGALEIADLLAEKIPYRVIDREIIEFIAKEKDLSQKAVEYFDERYPGKICEFFTMLLSEKTFLKSDYARQLTKTVNTLAGTEPTIFVGRGTHLILPTDLILSVRITSGKVHRVNRLSSILGISISEAEKTLTTMDREQDEFFRTVYDKDSLSLEEFDLTINMDRIREPTSAVNIIACSFEQKFGPVK